MSTLGLKGRKYKPRNKHRFFSGRTPKEAKMLMKKLVLQHYAKRKIPWCECCHETLFEFLTLHHVYGQGMKERKRDPRQRVIYAYTLNENFPKGFRVLCVNCNFSLGMYGYCPHKNEEGGKPRTIKQKLG